ncbi:MAG: hypothetical protein U5K69_20950 [Balneolaceae bacterium]|nr:hypothetical protein [Balneolaceae bacterium]
MGDWRLLPSMRVGGMLALSTIFNYKPVGEPRPTGEERFLRTSRATPIFVRMPRVLDDTSQDSAAISFYYGNEAVFENQVYSISSGAIDLNIGSELNEACNRRDGPAFRYY